MISWKELFDLDNVNDLQKAIDLIGKLDDKYESLIKGISNVSTDYKRTGEEIVKSTEMIAKGFEKLDPQTEAGRKGIEATTKALELQSAAYEDNKGKLKASEKVLEKLTDEQANFNKQSEETLKLNKEKERLSKKLINLDSKEAKEVAELKLRISEKNKALKDSAKETLGQVSLYEKERKRLRELKNEYKDMTLRQEENTEAAQKMKLEIQNLDESLKTLDGSVGDNFSKVGGYSEALEQWGGANEGLMGTIKGVRAQLVLLMSNPIVAIVAAIVAVLIALVKVWKDSGQGAKEFEQLMTEVGAVIDTVKQTMVAMVDGIRSFIKGNWSEGVDKISNSFGTFNERLEGNQKLGRQILATERELRKLRLGAVVEIAKLNKLMTEQQLIADDDTRSLIAREKASKRANALEIAGAEEKLRLAEKEEELLEDKLEQAKENGDELKEIAQEEADATAARIDAETELLRAKEEGAQRTRMILLDQFEQELDFLIDSFDNQKTINERKIADEKATLSQKKKLFDQTVALANNSFDAQIKTFERLNNVRLDENKFLKMNNLELFNHAKALGFSERAANRFLEVVRERRTAEQDLIDIQHGVLSAAKVVSKGVEFEYGKIPKMIEPIKLSLVTVQKSITDTLDKMSNGLSSWGGAFSDLFAALNARSRQQAEERITRLEEGKEKELEIAGDNAKAREAIERRFEREKQRIEIDQARRARRLAVFQKAISIGQSVIDTASATIKALRNGGGAPLGIPLAIATATFGALRTAAIAATPIPQYGKGTGNHKGGLAIVGDKGREFVMNPDGSVFLSNDKSQLVDLEQGSKVLTNSITENILSGGYSGKNREGANGVNRYLNQDKKQSGLKQAISRGNRELVDEVKSAFNQQENHTFKFTRRGLSRDVQRGNTTYKDVQDENQF